MTNGKDRADVAVLGAGIMGCCLALELAHRGYRVDLMDMAAAPMTAASLHNEGKLHLGFVYAKDPLKTTHGVMARGSLSFARILGRLTGCSPEDLRPSLPFHYFIPNDSQLDMAAITQHFEAVQESIREVSRQSGDRYMGRGLDRYFELNSDFEHAGLFSPRSTLGSFRTEELSIDPAAVADILCRAVLSQARINFVSGAEVLAVHRRAHGDLRIEWRRDRQLASSSYPAAANCLWDDKLRIDETAGVPDPGSWILRYKATIMITPPPAANRVIPSATGILGPYGDVVNHGDGSYYLSWYPLCKLAQSVGGDGRRLRGQIHTGALSRLIRPAVLRWPSLSRFIAAHAHQRFIRDNISAMAAYIPSLTGLLDGKRNRGVVSGGVILARGATDIDDPGSYLHQRSAIGPAVYGSYVTVDTGKYCTAPLYAVEAADLFATILA